MSEVAAKRAGARTLISRWLKRSRLAFALIANAAVTMAAADSAGAGEIESVPLSPPSERSGSTLFTTLPAEQTGVHAPNLFDDPALWTEHFERFAYGSMGNGVAIGDYDNDGRPDLFVTCKTRPNHLFRNLGHWRFEDVTEAAGVAAPAGGADGWNGGVTFADVNNDGHLDLYICRVGAPNLLYLNQGDGTFVERAHAAGIDVTDASVMGAFCDYDRDGWLDLYVVTNLLDYAQHPSGQRDYLFRNRGDGTFENVTAAAGIFGEGQKHAALWCDYDDDGWSDLYVTYDYGWPDQLFRNNGDGTFTNVLGAALPHVPRFSMGADAGDVNNDGRIDLFIPDMLPTTRERDQRSMIDARAHIAELPDPAMTPQVMRNALFLNTGTGRFLEAGFLAGVAATDWSWSPRLEDLDNDGWVDLHVTNGTIREFFDGDLRKRIENLPPAERKRVFKNSPVLRERNFALRNQGDLRFEDVSARWGLDHLGVSFGSALGDLDRDGDLDLVFVGFDEEVTVCRNDSAPSHRVTIALRGTRSNRLGVGATVHLETKAGVQVRQLVLARGYTSSSEPIVHFGLGDADRIDRLKIIWPGGHSQEFRDLAPDRHYVVREPETDRRIADDSEARAQFVEIGGPLGLAVRQPSTQVDELAAQPLLPLRQNQVGPGLAIGDVNGDRIDDVVIAGTETSPGKLLIAQADGRYGPQAPGLGLVTGVADASPLLFDADGDGRNDLLLPAGGVAQPLGRTAYRPRLLRNLGGGRFVSLTDVVPADLELSAGPAIAADFNRDGRLDVFIGGRVVPGDYLATPRSALLLNRAVGDAPGTRLEDATEAIAPGLARAGLISAALWSDVDGDSWIDLLVLPQWGPIRCWRNLEGVRFEETSAALGFARAGAGWWNSVASADFNGDGQPDYAVGNVGLNTRYRASSDAPVVLLRGVVDDSEKVQLIEAEYHEGVLVPVRGRSTMERVLPWVGRKLPSFKRYAGATLDEIFGAERIAAMQRFSVTELRSGVFLSQPDRTYRFAPFPRLAQIAPIYGLVAGDFDGDGFADVYAVHNSYAPIPEIGRFAGGVSQLLRGDGRGNFTAVTAAESHLIVPGEARALALIDLDRDAWPEFVVTRSNEPALVFGNTGVPGRNMLSVRLRGRPGNADAIGSRVTLLLQDGSSQTAEVTAGSGYCSQSTSALFFGFPDENRPRRLIVRWPWSERTELTPPQRGGAVTVTAPTR